MEIFLVSCVAFGAALLTFFSGFGLGTLLTPIMALFFPIDVAIGLTAIVHLLNNVFKLVLVGKRIDWSVFVRFGPPAILAALLGAWVLLNISDIAPIHSYEFWGKDLKLRQ